MTLHDFKQTLLDELYAPYTSCTAFPLYEGGATRVVLGHGNPNASLMIIGEAPGQEEDKQGKPFVGRSGLLLSKALEQEGITRQDVFITNVVKCRPPNNRTPTLEEINSYTELVLRAEIKIVRPKVILLLGAVALQAVLGKSGISKVRGVPQSLDTITVIPTYHPAYILRNPAALEFLCKDIQKAKSFI